MVKKFVYTLAAAAMTFGFAACSSDEPLAGAAGQDGLVTFTAQLPAELASRAFGEGENAKKLTVYVYEKDVKTLIETKTAEFPADGLTTTVELQLVNGKSYDILFWADAYGENGADTPFSYTASTQTVKVDYTKMASNEDKGDAFFFAEKGLEVKGAINKTIYLTRPFAQINFGTDDLDAAAVVNAFGITADNKFGTVMSKLALTAAMPDQLNLFDGTVTTTEGAAATAFAAVAPTEEDTFPYGTDYDYMSMSYVLVGADRDVVDLKYTVLNGDAEYNTLEIAAVPVQRNYRTNIYGSLLTSKVNFTVEIKPGFTDSFTALPVEVNTTEEFLAAVEKGIGVIIPEGTTITASTDQVVLDKPAKWTVDGELNLTASEENQSKNFYRVTSDLKVSGKGTIKSSGFESVFFATAAADGSLGNVEIDGINFEINPKDKENGSALYVARGASASISNSKITTDTRAITSNSGKLNVKDVEIISTNTNPTQKAIYISGNVAVLENVKIESGGSCMVIAWGPTVTLTNCDFYSKSTNQYCYTLSCTQNYGDTPQSVTINGGKFRSDGTDPHSCIYAAEPFGVGYNKPVGIESMIINGGEFTQKPVYYGYNWAEMNGYKNFDVQLGEGLQYTYDESAEIYKWKVTEKQ